MKVYFGDNEKLDKVRIRRDCFHLLVESISTRINSSTIDFDDDEEKINETDLTEDRYAYKRTHYNK